MCQVSDVDFYRVVKLKWHAFVNRRKDRTIKNVYARNSTRKSDGSIVRTLMHRFLVGAPFGTEVDHRDHDGLNNQRRNLRVSNTQQNQGNRTINKDNTSGFKGVTHFKRNRKWGATVRRKFLGLFSTAEKAAHAYDKESERVFGKFSLTNKKLGRL